MKNYTTPRTLADCTFTRGYATAYRKPRRTWHAAEWVMLALFAGFVASIIFWS